MVYKKIVNEELRIAAVNIADLEIDYAISFLEQWEKGAKLGSLTLYYDLKEDYVVLNRDNKNYNTYLEMAKVFLTGDPECIDKVKKAPPGLREVIGVFERCVNVRNTKTEIERAMQNDIDNCYRPVLDEILKKDDSALASCTAFRYGMMCGKREERARRKKKVS